MLNSVADKVVSRIRQGMGGVFLHSAKNSKPFLRLTGTTSVTAPVPWKETGENERLFVVSPSHPIAAEIPSGHIIPNEEPYCEYFDIPKPDDIVFLGGFGNGMCVRAGVTFTRGAGKIFYFQPGHDTFLLFSARTRYVSHLSRPRRTQNNPERGELGGARSRADADFRILQTRTARV